MNLEDFTNPSGEIIHTLEGHKAFLPRILPPNLDLVKLINPLGETIQLLGELRGAARRTENPFILVEPLQRREALTTSAMEGTHTSIENLVLEEENLSSTRDENARETFNYVMAIRNAIRNLEKYPISHRVIKEAHIRLLSGLSNERGANKRPGEYKQAQNWIGGGRNIANARYVPPPPEKTQICMDDIERYINRENTSLVERVLDLGVVHYQFEAVHPFGDGNGRIGRMLITLMPMQNGLLDLPLLYLSPFLEQRKDEYIDLMYAVTTKSAWTEWLQFFLEALKSTCKDTIEKIESLISLQMEYKQRVASIGRSAKLPETVDRLFRYPSTTIPNTMEKLDVTYGAAQSIVKKLVLAGILKEVVDTYPKRFIAHEIMAISNRS
jgi:Fic family protein